MVELPSFNEFKNATSNQDLIALSTNLTWDHEPAIALAGRFQHEDQMFLLESATQGPGHDRYSFVGFDPLWTLESDLKSIEIKSNLEKSKVPLGDTDPLKEVEKYSTSRRLKELRYGSWYCEDFSLPNLGGVFGFLGFDVSSLYEPTIGTPPDKELDLPDIYFMMPKNLMVFDQFRRCLIVVRFIDVSGVGESELEKVYEREVRATRSLLNRLQNSYVPRKVDIVKAPLDYESPKASIEKEDFLRKVNQCLEYIKTGDIFQIQIGNRLTIKTQSEPFDVFRHLRMLNPSPYMFYYKIKDQVILGASPEMMVNVDGDRLTHRPIAGTRKKVWDPVKDQLMRKELVTDVKERAEHVMLVDLSRNDIGRISIPGTVDVEELMVVEEYSHVFHMVSQVSGTMIPEYTAADAMKVSFPNGTVSGAPKVRAMQIIYEMESVSREFYAGSLGLFTFNGDLKSTILIRSLYMSEGYASTQASAGVVYDSIPEMEWMETRNKMAACLTAIQNTR